MWHILARLGIKHGPKVVKAMKRKPVRKAFRNVKARISKRVKRRRYRGNSKNAVRTLQMMMHDTHFKSVTLTPVTAKRVLLQQRPFNNIGVGDNRWERSGDKIDVTLFRWDYTFTYTGIDPGAIYVHVMLVKQYRDVDIATRFYAPLNDNDAPTTYAVHGANAAGDRLRETLRYYTKEWKILKYKKFTVGTPGYGQHQNIVRFRTGKFLYKPKMPMSVRYSGIGAPPYPDGDIWPRVALLYWLSQPDITVTDANCEGNFTMNQTMYFKG